MIAITTRSSIKVKPRRRGDVIGFFLQMKRSVGRYGCSARFRVGEAEEGSGPGRSGSLPVEGNPERLGLITEQREDQTRHAVPRQGLECN